MATTTRVALFGDSYIDHLDRFCHGDLKIPGEVGFFGRGGTTVNNYDETLYSDMIKFRPDVVFLNLGGSDIKGDSDPKEIAPKVLTLINIDQMKGEGVKTVYCAEFCERGKFPKDKTMIKKCFNAQRRKINKILDRSVTAKFVTLNMKGDSDAKEIAPKVLTLINIDQMKGEGVKTVYCAEFCERGKFPKDKTMIKKCFNAQRRKINKILDRSVTAKFVTLNMRFLKDYSTDKIHFSKPDGTKKFMFFVRRILMSHTDLD